MPILGTQRTCENDQQHTMRFRTVDACAQDREVLGDDGRVQCDLADTFGGCVVVRVGGGHEWVGRHFVGSHGAANFSN